MAKEMEDFLLKNPRANTETLRQHLQEAGWEMSEGQVKRARDAENFEARNARPGFLVSPDNEQKRLDYCRDLISTGEDFQNWVFTDESTVQLGRNGRTVWVRRDDPTAHVLPRSKFPARIMVWAGVSVRGATSIVVLRRGVTVDSGVYCQILEQAFLPFTKVRH